MGRAERPTLAARRLPDVEAVEILLRWIAARPVTVVPCEQGTLAAGRAGDPRGNLCKPAGEPGAPRLQRRIPAS